MSKNYSFINWHEGMYLMPEHFQESDKVQERRRKYILKNFINFFYGIKSMKLNENLITEGIFSLIYFDGMMPNGEILQINKDESVELDFTNAMNNLTQSEEEITIHLCISYEVNDFELEKYNSIKIPKLSPAKTLIASNKKPEGYISMPIAKIIKQNRAFNLSNYIAPQVHFNHDLSIFKEYKNLIIIMKQKIIYLTKKINNSNVNPNDSIIIKYTNIKQSLVSQYFLLNQVFELEHIQPHIVFEKLVSFLSAIITLNNKISIFDIKYNHNNILGSFSDVYTKIYNILDSVKEDYKEIQAIQSDENFSFFVDNKIQDVIVEFKFSEDSTRDMMLSWVKNCIIASRSKFQSACDNRVLGINREIITKSIEMQITNSTNGIMCKFDINSKYFLFDEDVIISNPSRTKIHPKNIIFYK